MVTRILMLGALLSTLIRPAHGAPATAAVMTHAEVAREIAIQDVSVRDGAVSGTVVNKSSATLHDVELRIEQVWLWSDERHPGPDSPGRTLPFPLRQDVAPHASASFAFQTPPLDQRSGGRFVTTVDVSSFTEAGL